MNSAPNICQITRSVIIMIGICSLLLGVSKMEALVFLISQIPDDSLMYYNMPIPWLAAIATPLILFMIGLFLIKRSPRIAEKISRSHETVPQWEYATYRLAFTLAGILILANSLPHFGQIAMNLTMRPEDPLYQTARISALVSLFWQGLVLVFAIYLFIGAPHIIRWQTSRIGTHTPEPDDTGTRYRAPR